MANGRSSEDERKLEGGAAAAAPPQDNGLHPAFYIACVSLVSVARLRGCIEVDGLSNFSPVCGLL